MHGTLTDLTLRAHRLTIESNSEDASPYHVTFDRLRPLIIWENIKVIALRIPYGLDEREFLCLASSWPQLEEFAVGEESEWAPPSAITPGGFLQLLERCRSLRALHYAFDTRGYAQVPLGHPWGGLRMPRGAYVNVLHSPVEETSIEALAVFFHVAPHPDFTLTTQWNNPYFSGWDRPTSSEVRELHHGRWGKIHTLGLDMWEKKRGLRRSLEDRRGRSPQEVDQDLRV